MSGEYQREAEQTPLLSQKPIIKAENWPMNHEAVFNWRVTTV